MQQVYYQVYNPVNQVWDHVYHIKGDNE
jgi:hypothetical protein